jgi:hypothetical protein
MQDPLSFPMQAFPLQPPTNSSFPSSSSAYPMNSHTQQGFNTGPGGGGEDRLAELRGLNARIPSSVAGPSSQHRAELSAAQHKLPTPPVQDEPRHVHQGSGAGHRLMQEGSSSSAVGVQPQQQQGGMVLGWPGPSASAGETKKPVPKGLSFKKKTVAPTLPPPPALPSLPPARQRQAQAKVQGQAHTHNAPVQAQTNTHAPPPAQAQASAAQPATFGRLRPASFGAPGLPPPPATLPSTQQAPQQRRPSAPEVASSLPAPPGLPRRSLPGPGTSGQPTAGAGQPIPGNRSPQRLGEAAAIGRRPAAQEPPTKDPRSRC